MRKIGARLVGFMLALGLFVFASAPWCAANTFVATYGASGQDYGLGAVPMADGGYVFAGGTDSAGAGSLDLWVIRTDFEGNVVWDKTYGGIGNELFELFSITETKDDGLLLTCMTNSFGAGKYDAWLLRLDGEGNVLWQKTYGGSQNDAFTSLLATEGGDFYAAGISDSFSAGDTDAWVLKLDGSGNVLWEYTYGGTASDVPLAATPASGGGILMVGETESFGASLDDAWVLRLDGEGNPLWERTYAGTSDDSARAVAAAADGFLIVGSTDSFGAGNHDVWVLKLDASGNILWQETVGGSGDDFAWDVEILPDGGSLILGYTRSFGGGKADIWVLRLDAAGNVEWEHTYGGADDENAFDLEPTADGGFVIAGGTSTFTGGKADLWALKLNSAGDPGDPSCNHMHGPSSALVTASGAKTAAVSSTRNSSAETVSNTTGTVASLGASLGSASLSLILCAVPDPVMPRPAAEYKIPYSPVVNPVVDTGPLLARPIGLGDTAGGTLDLNVMIPRFDGLVDVYLGLYAPAVSKKIFLVLPDGSLQPADKGVDPWCSDTNEAPAAELFGPIKMAALPPGDYTFFVAVTRPGAWDRYYLWSSTVKIP
jgi:hypothetical protein